MLRGAKTSALARRLNTIFYVLSAFRCSGYAMEV